MFFSGIADEAGKPLATQIRAHTELGWKHIEVRNVNETTLAYAEDKDFEQIHAALRKAGLQVSCFASQIANWARDIQGPFEPRRDRTEARHPAHEEDGHAVHPHHELPQQEQLPPRHHDMGTYTVTITGTFGSTTATGTVHPQRSTSSLPVISLPHLSLGAAGAWVFPPSRLKTDVKSTLPSPLGGEGSGVRGSWQLSHRQIYAGHRTIPGNS